MFYTRSSFITWLTKVKNCEVQPLRDRNTLSVTNGIARGYIYSTPHDRIDWEEIEVLCLKIYLELPSQKDLQKLE